MFSRKINYFSDVPSEAEAKKIADEGLKNYGIDGTNWLEECKRLRKAGVKIRLCKEKFSFLRLITAVSVVYQKKSFAKKAKLFNPHSSVVSNVIIQLFFKTKSLKLIEVNNENFRSSYNNSASKFLFICISHYIGLQNQ